MLKIFNPFVTQCWKLIDMQNDDTFFATTFKLINENKMSSSEVYIVNDEKPLHTSIREEDGYFMNVVTQAHIKYVLHQVEDEPGHNGTDRTYQYLKQLYS